MTTTASHGTGRPTGTRTGVLIAGVAGVLWPVLAFLRVPLTGVLDQPSWTDDRSEIVSFYADSNFDAAFMTGMAVVTAAYVLFLVFVAKIADLVGGTDGGSRWVGYLILGGAAFDTALVIAYLAPFGAAVFWAGHGGLSEDAYLSLHGLSFSFLWLELITITLWMTPLGVAIVRTRLFPGWLGWAMLVSAAALLVSFFLPYDVWIVTGALPYLWIFIAAVIMIRRIDRFVAAAPSSA